MHPKQFPINVRICPVRRNPSLKGGLGYWGCLETLKRGTMLQVHRVPWRQRYFQATRVRKKCTPFEFAGEQCNRP